MKAYKYKRFIQTWHWSESISEEIMFFPEAGLAIYSGGSSKEKYSGVSTDAKIIEEAISYVEDVNSGKISKDLPADNKMLLQFQLNSYVKEFPSKSTGKHHVSYPLWIFDLEEKDIDITVERLKELDKEHMKFVFAKAEFIELSKKHDEPLLELFK